VFLRAVFESQAPTESPVPITVTSDLKTHSETAEFTENHQKVEKAPIFTQNTPETLSLGDLMSEYDVDSFPVPTTIVTVFETRSSSAGFMKKLEKSPIFPLQPLVLGDLMLKDNVNSSPEPTTIVSDFETRPMTANLTQNDQKLEKFIKIHPKTPGTTRFADFNWADDVDLFPEPTPIVAASKTHPGLSKFIKNDRKLENLPNLTQISPESLPAPSTMPEKCSRDMTCLCSSLPNPFSSLHRRRHNNKKSHHSINFQSQLNCQHTLPNLCYHISVPHSSHHPSQPHLPVSLNWDQDPRLAHLSNALRALGWFRCQAGDEGIAK
jgi:hypothetical protein